jgi:DNA-binding response OmpR family regulator
MTEAEHQQKIMIVDDTPQNLKLLGNMLREEGYHVYSFPKGEFALKAAERNTPDLILLDINMPGMNGYEVCAKLQEDPVLREIPVIFLSALNETEDKVKAFRAGGVDYITKPFQFEEVIARIRTHLALLDAQRALRGLLDSTVIGSVRAMAELLALSSPQEFGQTLRVARRVREMGRRMNLPKPWKYEIAALLSNLGYTFAREDAGTLSLEERAKKILAGDRSQEADKSLLLAARVIRRIPRLENVESMVTEQRYCPEWNSSWHRWDEAVLGGQILKLANDFEVLSMYCNSPFTALGHIRKIEGVYNRELMETFDAVLTDEIQGKSAKILPGDLRKGMILTQEMFNRQGLPLLPPGTELTHHILERIQDWALMGSIPGSAPISVLLPPEGKKTSREALEGDLDEFFSPDSSS